jgi:mRNA interferase RelE/StbE
MRHQIEIKSSALKELQALPVPIRDRISRHIDELSVQPRPNGSQKLSGTAHAYRIRVGMYRIVYEIQDQRLVVMIIRIAHRREVYR